MTIRKLCYLALGMTGLALGALGAVLPLLPAFPFLLLAAWGSAKAATGWTAGSRAPALYRDNLADLAAGRGLTRGAKLRIMGTVTVLMAVGFWMMHAVLIGQIVLGCVWVGHLLYFLFGIKTAAQPAPGTRSLIFARCLPAARFLFGRGHVIRQTPPKGYGGNKRGRRDGFMLHIVLCDDEGPFAESLARVSGHWRIFRPGPWPSRCSHDPDRLTDALPCDLLFLDIDLGATNGIRVARRLRQTRPDMVLIFVTNYKEYAPEGYEVNAFRYLAKDELDAKLAPYFTAALAACRTRLRTVELLCDGEPVAVPLPKLDYVESRGREQILHLRDARRDSLTTRTTMNLLEEKLTDQGFQ